MALAPRGLCVVAVLRLSPWGSAVSQKAAEGFGHGAHWPQVRLYPPRCLGGKDSADLFHSPEFAYVSSQS